MAGARKVPDLRILQGLSELGLTNEQIAERYGVTAAGVQRALDRGRARAGRPTYRDILPWVVEPEHHRSAVMAHVRVLLRQRSGQEVPLEEVRALHAWLDWVQRRGLVLNYHPEAPPNRASPAGGFYYMDRLPSDEWIIRRPVSGIVDGE